MLFSPKHLAISLATVICTLANPVCAQTSSYGELQATYMYNFAKYISWPDEAQEFVIGVFEEADIMNDLETILKGKKVRGKPIVLKKTTTTDGLLECNIIYLSESKSRSLGHLITSIGSKNILIVTEEDLIKKGATISFAVEDDKLRFKVKKKALDQVGLTASEGLLKLAILF